MSEKLQGGFALWLVVVVLGLLITPAVWPAQGRTTNNHYGSVPTGVTELSSQNYLIERTSAETPSQLCLNGGSNGNIDSVSVVHSAGNELFVSCDTSQTWNDHRPLGRNWGWAFTDKVISNPAILGVMAFLLLAFSTPGLISGGRYHRQLRKKRAVKAAGAGESRAALGDAYARGKITQKDLEQGLDKINQELL